MSTATVVDAGRSLDEVEHDVRDWINTSYTGTVPSGQTQPGERARPRQSAEASPGDTYHRPGRAACRERDRSAVRPSAATPGTVTLGEDDWRST